VCCVYSFFVGGGFVSPPPPPPSRPQQVYVEVRGEHRVWCVCVMCDTHFGCGEQTCQIVSSGSNEMLCLDWDGFAL